MPSEDSRQKDEAAFCFKVRFKNLNGDSDNLN